ncbi:MAG: TAXI family TRAP transporter solute-binding subunit [Hyphomicrobiaceae bacterium]
MTNTLTACLGLLWTPKSLQKDHPTGGSSENGTVTALNDISTALLGLLFLIIAAFSAQATDKRIVFGSGGTTGVYYPVAISMCRLFNADHSQNGFSCSVDSTGGSIDNLNRLRTGAVNFAIVQSDWQSHAFNGTSVFASQGPQSNLRALFALYSEAFTVLARSRSNIVGIGDLRGRRVNIGNPGSGQRATMEIVMKAFGWSRFDFSTIREFGSDHQAQALCDGEIEAIVFVAGHPSGTIKSATQKCPTNFVRVDGPVINQLVDRHDYYRLTNIPAGLYSRQSNDVPTFGLTATAVTTSDVPSSLVKALLKSIYGNIGRLRKMHPALAQLQTEEMSRDLMPAPLHDEAVKFYQSLTRPPQIGTSD